MPREFCCEQTMPNMKKRTYLVGYDVAQTPLSLNAQDRLEGDPNWDIEHVFVGLWVVRTLLGPQSIADRFATALTGEGSGAGVIVAKVSRRSLLANGLTPRRVKLFRRLLPAQ